MKATGRGIAKFLTKFIESVRKPGSGKLSSWRRSQGSQGVEELRVGVGRKEARE